MNIPDMNFRNPYVVTVLGLLVVAIDQLLPM